MSSEERRKATLGFVGDVCPADNCTPTGSLAEINSTNIADGVGQRFINLMHVDMGDDSYEHGYGELMERECEQPRYRAIGQIVSALPAHSSLLDVGTMANYLPTLDYTGIDISKEALRIARRKHLGVFICTNAEDFRVDMSAYLL